MCRDEGSGIGRCEESGEWALIKWQPPQRGQLHAPATPPKTTASFLWPVKQP
jgi:hypothetical protein